MNQLIGIPRDDVYVSVAISTIGIYFMHSHIIHCKLLLGDCTFTSLCRYPGNTIIVQLDRLML